MLTFGQYLGQVIVGHRKTDDEVAAALHMPVAEVVAWIDNKVVPTEEQIEALGNYFERPDLFGRRSSMSKPQVRHRARRDAGQALSFCYFSNLAIV